MEKSKSRLVEAENTLNALYVQTQDTQKIILKLVEEIHDVKINVAGVQANLKNNNIILQEHHSRSTRLESIVDAMKDTMTSLSVAFQSMTNKLVSVENKINPIEKHVTKIERIMSLFDFTMQLLPKSLRAIAFIFTFVTSAIGCYYLVIELISKLGK